MKNTITMNEVKNLVNYVIDRNLKLQEAGKMPIAISLESSAGVGKTSIIQQIAEERGMTLTKLNFAELDEPGDLIGYPEIEYECQVCVPVKDANGQIKAKVLPDTVWANSKQLDNPPVGQKYRHTGNTRMGYAKPAWVPQYNDKGVIVLLDDYVRASQQLLQSAMELILTQRYISWSLPKKTTIVLTNNPDDGSNIVNSLDEAQKTRFMNYEVEWSKEAWTRWAEQSGMNNRCINFVLSFSDEIFEADEQGNRICNPRSFSMFADMIGGIDDWDDADNLQFINTVAKGCFKDESGRFSQMFTSFLRNKMHLLISPKDMLLGDWSKVKTIIENTVYDQNGMYRADLATLLERRFTTYVDIWLDSKENTPISVVKNRLVEFVNASQGERRLFSPDLFHHMLKNITANHKNQTNKLLFEPALAALLS